MVFELMTQLGQDGAMPERLERAADMPKAADRAFHALSSRARVEVLRILLAASDQTRTQIAEATGLGTGTVRIALEELERLGYLEASDPPGDRHGRRVTYSALPDQLRTDVADLMGYIYGQ